MDDRVLSYRFQQDLKRLLNNYTDAGVPVETQIYHLDFELSAARQKHLVAEVATRNSRLYELDQPYEPRNYDDLKRSGGDV